MSMFGDGNTMERGSQRAVRKQQPADNAIREMTGAELAGSMQRKAIKASEPAVAPVTIKPQNHPSTDDIARRHNLYTSDKKDVRTYYVDQGQKHEVMRSAPDKITTKREDKQTVSAMLDIAKARGWDTVKLKGTAAYKAEAWVQASQAGLKVEGYAPTQADQQALAKRQRDAAPVEAKAAITSQKVEIAASAPPAVANSAKLPVQAYEAKTSVWNAMETAGKEARATATKAPTAKASQSVAA